MIDLVAYRISIGTFSNSHAGKEARLAEMFPNVRHKIITMLPILLLAISALRIRDDAGVESNPGPTKTFDCGECGRTFLQPKHLRRHKRDTHQANNPTFSCASCNRSYSRHDNMLRHQLACMTKTQSGRGGIKRPASPMDLDVQSPKLPRTENPFVAVEIASALRRALVSYRINLSRIVENDVIGLLRDAVISMSDKLDESRKLAQSKAIKFFVVADIEFVQATDPSIITIPPISLHSETYEVYEETDLNEILQFIVQDFMRSIDEFQRNGSGWVIKDIIHLDTTVLEFDPLRASSYIPLPKEVRDKKAVINIKNDDQRCFLWSVIAALYPADINVVCLSNYIQHAHKFDTDGISFPDAIKSDQEIRGEEQRQHFSVRV